MPDRSSHSPSSDSALHTIRLHGPWAAECCTEAGVTRERVKVPLDFSDWPDLLGQVVSGLVTLERSFNCPTNLAAGQQVWLVVESVGLTADVLLNGNSLGPLTADQPLRVSIADRLGRSNRLRISLSATPDLALGCLSEVRLEIA